MPVDISEFKQAFQPDKREDVYRKLRDLVSTDLVGGWDCIGRLADVAALKEVVLSNRRRLTVLERIFARAEALAVSDPYRAAKVLKKVRENVLELRAQLLPAIDDVNIDDVNKGRLEPPA
jgi:hypothetical protein